MLGGITLGFYAILGIFSRSRSAPIYLFSRPATLVIPFGAWEKDCKAAGILKVPVRDGYTFYIRTDCENNGSPEEIRRVQGLVGVSHIDQFGRFVETNRSLTLPIKLNITKVSGHTETTILDQEFRRHRLEGVANGRFWNEITGLQLDQGDYRILLETLEEDPQMRGTLVALDVHVPYRS